MAASWLRVNEIFTSLTDDVYVVARVQSINASQRIVIIYDDDDQGTSSSSSNIQVSIADVRSMFDVSSSAISPGQCIQVYGRIVRQAGEIIRIDAQLIRQLGHDFDLNEYLKGLMLTRQYMNSIDDADTSVETSSHPIRNFL